MSRILWIMVVLFGLMACSTTKAYVLTSLGGDMGRTKMRLLFLFDDGHYEKVWFYNYENLIIEESNTYVTIGDTIRSNTFEYMMAKDESALYVNVSKVDSLGNVLEKSISKNFPKPKLNDKMLKKILEIRQKRQGSLKRE